MNALFVIEYTASILFLLLIVFVLYKNPKSALNRTCALLLFCFFLWNLFTAFYYAAETKENAMLWMNISSFGWCSFPVCAFWFALVFTKKENILNKWYFYIIIAIIPAFFISMQWTGELTYDNVKTVYGWTGVWAVSVWSAVYFTYYFLLMIATVLLSFLFISKTEKKYEHKQAVIITVTAIIPIVLGAFTDVIFPVLKWYSIPQMANILTLIWAGGIVYAITKYGFLTLTPAYASSDIIRTMNDSLILIDPSGKIIEINKTALNILGYKREEIIGRNSGMLFSGAMDPIIGNVTLKKSMMNLQDSFRSKNGKNIPVSISYSVMRDEDGNLIGIVYVARDMREIIRFQEKERAYAIEKTRAEALQERAAELQEAYDKLSSAQAMLIQSEKMSAVGQLAGGIAHEINNPMGVILGFSQSIVKRIDDNDPLYKPLKSIEREAVRCRKLIQDLLSFSRSGKTGAELTDIRKIIDETLPLIEARTKILNIQINRNYSHGSYPVLANQNQIQQVIVNICNNAMDAMPEGGNITVSTRKEGEEVILEISDTGKGMSEEVKKHIFEPFFTTKDVGKGTGLGLSLCYEIVRKHKGSIEAESEEGKGSAIRIKLPLA